MTSQRKTTDLEQRIVDAEACYQKALVSFGAEHGDVDEVIRARQVTYEC